MGKTVALKYETGLIKRDGKYFVSVSTPLGTPNVEEPTTFEPDDQYEIGPFDTEEAAKKQQRETEDQLRKQGKLWIPTSEYRAQKKAREKAKEKARSKQRPLF